MKPAGISPMSWHVAALGLPLSSGVNTGELEAASIRLAFSSVAVPTLPSRALVSFSAIFWTSSNDASSRSGVGPAPDDGEREPHDSIDSRLSIEPRLREASSSS